MKSIEIKFNSTPPSTQHIYQYRAVGRNKLMKYMTKQAKEWKLEFIKEIESQLPKDFKMFEEEKLEVVYNLTFGTNHKRDVDNYSKLTLDSMNGLVYKDDSQITSMYVTKNVKKKEPSITLKIIEKRKTDDI